MAHLPIDKRHSTYKWSHSNPTTYHTSHKWMQTGAVHKKVKCIAVPCTAAFEEKKIAVIIGP